MIRRPPRSTLDRSSAASDVYKRQALDVAEQLGEGGVGDLDAEHVDAGEDHAVVAEAEGALLAEQGLACLLYTSPSPRDRTRSRMPSSA